MKTTKHTPGPSPAPWKIEPGAILDANGKLVCIPIQGSNASANPASNYDVPGYEANRAIIAAAPALLQELKNTVAAIEKWGKEHPESGGWIGVIHGALKAIAQAEGGAQ